MEPLHVQYGYDHQSVDVVNDTYTEQKGMKVHARIYSLQSKLLANQEVSVDVPADSAINALDLPKPDGLTMTFFVKLDLQDAQGKPVSDNFYWLSAKPDTLDWAHRQDTVYTPQAEFGDLTGLASLPQVRLEASATAKRHANTGLNSSLVRVKNPSSSLAFQVRLRLATKEGSDIVPVFWQDNYFSLLPREERSIEVDYDSATTGGSSPVVEVGGFNIVSAVVAEHAAAAPAKQ